MFCTKCGSKTDDSAKVCSACGQPISNMPSPSDKSHTSGKAIAGFIFGLVGIIPYLSLLLGILAIVFSALAKSEIGKNKNLSGNGLATAGLILGIFDIVIIGVGVFAAIAIPNFIAMQIRAREATVKNQMHTLQMAMEEYKTIDKLNRYPTSMESQLPDGSNFRDMISKSISTNPFTNAPINIIFKNMPGRSLEEDYMINISRGDINVYCDGQHYLIIGGGRDERPLALKLRSE